jgi:hypothetical protein
MQSYWEVIKPLFSIIEFGEGPESFANSIKSIPRSSVILFAAHMCISEVHNGGFLQLFWNNTGVLVPEGIEGFSTIGMPQMSAILSQAARQLGTPYPRGRDDRWDTLLVASGHSVNELEQIFGKHRDAADQMKGLYLAFGEATRNLGFDDMNKQLWESAKIENGGFQEAATRYAAAPHLIQEQLSPSVYV